MQATLATHAQKLGLSISIEAGGALCGAGSGNSSAASALRLVGGFLGAGGRFAFYALESVFSRTHAGCPAQPLNHTVAELADYASVISAALPSARLFLCVGEVDDFGVRRGGLDGGGHFFHNRYDALPHYAVADPAGTTWPASVPGYTLDLRRAEISG